MPFYSNEKIEQQLDLIHHMLQFGDELLLVSGKEGVGKSRQLQELMHRLGEGWQICHLSGKENSQIPQLFEQVSQSFGYDYSTVPSAELLSGFQHHLEQKEAGKTYALLIDDAEFLDASTLEVVTHLSQLQNDKGLLLRVVLFSAPALSDAPILKTVPLRGVAIEPLDSQQSQGYIDFCIEQGRYAIGQSPSTARQQQIVKRAEGFPGQIESMLQNGSQPMIDSWKKIFDWRVAAVLFFLLAVGMGYLLNSGSEVSTTTADSASKSDKLTTLQQPVIRKSLMATAPADPVVVVQQETEEALISDLLKQDESLATGMPTSTVDTLAKKSADGALIESNGDSAMAVAAPDLPIQSTPIGGNEPVENEGTLTEPLAELPNELPTETKPDNIEIVVAKDEVDEVDEVGDRVWLQNQPATSFTIQLVAAGREAALDELIKRELLQKDLARFSFVRDGRVIHVLTQGVYSERSSAEVAIRRYSQGVRPWIRPIGDIQHLFADNPPLMAKAAPTPTANITETAGIKDSAWIWSQDPEMITIQLMAGGNRQLLQSYVGQSLKLGVTTMIESTRESKPWYILLHGRYSSREEARSAITKLPQPLQSAKPWVRSFASVHDQLSQAN